MKSNKTEIVFILDRSGSMVGLEADTIGGFNSLLLKQKAEPGEAVVTTVLFDDSYELLHDRIDIRGVAPITDREYYVRGCTALLDAIGKTIRKIADAQSHTAEGARANKVLFVITTDGQENASHEYSFQKVRGLVETRQREFGWEFIFLGANIDAIATAAHFGIGADRAANYHADSTGTNLNYAVVSDAISQVRACAPLHADWKERIDRDFQDRGKGRKEK
jgi:uncharacterized protein YegL